MSGAWVNPEYDPYTNAGDFAVVTLASPLPESSVIGLAEAGDTAYVPGTSAAVYGWGHHRRRRLRAEPAGGAGEGAGGRRL